MSLTETAPIHDDQARKTLEAFLTDNPELERLEGLLAQFNIFEAIGAVRHEVRHSDFLAYLLNPQENHGLGDEFIKRLLQKAVASVDSVGLPVTLIDLDFWNLNAATVQREWQRIDIFLRDEAHQFSVIIENKIDTGEHDEQLARYYESVRRQFPNDRILALYLTKEGDEPSDEHYLPIGYGLVCETVEKLAERRASLLGPDVRTLMMHYAQMLRRHIMSDTEIARLCGLIYQKHRAALDLIYEHRPSHQAETAMFLQSLIEATPGVVWGGVYYKDRWVIFNGEVWSAKINGLYFAFDNSTDTLALKLEIGPGERTHRQRLLEFASEQQPPFNLKQKRLNAKHNTIFSRSFLTALDFQDLDWNERENKIRLCWEQFIGQDLPAISSVLVEAGWCQQESKNEQPL